MIRSTVKTFNHFPQVTAAIEQAAREGVDAASREAAQVAQANASIKLQLDVKPARSIGDGYAGGIVSRRQTSTDGPTTPIAAFFDKGTLGNRRGKLKRGRKSSWTDGRGRTYKRAPIEPDSGIKAERFFLKARIAGRRALLARVLRDLR